LIGGVKLAETRFIKSSREFGVAISYHPKVAIFASHIPRYPPCVNSALSACPKTLKPILPLILLAAVAVMLLPAHGLLGQSSPASAQSLRPTERDGQHDFDFEIGTWRTHLRRLLHPLTGSTTWVEYDGTSVVSKLWDGRANLVELEADGPQGHFRGLNLRLYDPESRQWSLNFASGNGGGLSQPTIGRFKNGRGEFFDQETLNGKAILVRFVISDVTADSCRFEQAFSDDGGKTWEVNWIASDTRVKLESDKKR
jgi:hypothetical protein